MTTMSDLHIGLATMPDPSSLTLVWLPDPHTLGLVWLVGNLIDSICLVLSTELVITLLVMKNQSY